MRGLDHFLTNNFEFGLSRPVNYQQTTKISTKCELQRIEKALPTRFLLVIQRTKFDPGKLKKSRVILHVLFYNRLMMMFIKQNDRGNGAQEQGQDRC